MPLKIAIVGAECTGKSTLAQALGSALKAISGEHWVVVDEYLREWCDTMQRTPEPHEQSEIAAEQCRRIERAAMYANVIADTTPLMTAVYSQTLFSEGSLLASTLELQRSFDLTAVAWPDFSWCAGDWQRDGSQMQQRVHATLMATLTDAQLDFIVCRGSIQERLELVLNALNFSHDPAPQLLLAEK